MVSKKIFSSILFYSLLFSANSYALDFNLEKLITDVATEVINNIPNQQNQNQNQNPSNTTPETSPKEVNNTEKTEPTNIPSKKIQTADNTSTHASSSSRIIDVESIPSTMCNVPVMCVAHVINETKTEVCPSFKFELLDKEAMNGKDGQPTKYKDGTQRYRYKVKVLDDREMQDFKNRKANGKKCNGFEGWFEYDNSGNITQKKSEYFNAKF